MIEEGTVIENRWTICERIGRGGAATIFSAFDNDTNDCVAVKVSRARMHLKSWSAISTEYTIYNKLLQTGHPTGIPHPIDFLTAESRHVLVLPLLGQSLKSNFDECGALSLEKICGIGYRMLQILEYIHSKGVIHLDIKPDNIMLGRGKEEQKVFLIDFGVSRGYLDGSGNQVPFKTGLRFIGTQAFSSIHIDKGCERAPRDDLESLIYSLVVLHKQKLPWTDKRWKPVSEESNKNFGSIKELNRGKLCHGMPVEFQRAWEKVSNLQYYEKPDYRGIRDILLAASSGRKDTLKVCKY